MRLNNDGGEWKDLYAKTPNDLFFRSRLFEGCEKGRGSCSKTTNGEDPKHKILSREMKVRGRLKMRRPTGREIKGFKDERSHAHVIVATR